MVSGVLVTSRHFRPSEWARMQVGYAGGGGGDEGCSASMGGGGVSDEEEVHPPPPRQTPLPSQAATQPNSTPLKKTFETTVRLRVRLGDRRRDDPP